MVWQEQRRAERKSGKGGEYSRVEYKVFSGSFHAYKSMLLWRPQWEAFSVRILSEMMHPSPSQLQKSLGENLHSIILQNLPFFAERWTDCPCIFYSFKSQTTTKTKKCPPWVPPSPKSHDSWVSGPEVSKKTTWYENQKITMKLNTRY